MGQGARPVAGGTEARPRLTHFGAELAEPTGLRSRRSSPLHLSEHVLTSFQSFAHFLRQVNGRPHAAQIF